MLVKLLLTFYSYKDESSILRDPQLNWESHKERLLPSISKVFAPELFRVGF